MRKLLLVAALVATGAAVSATVSGAAVIGAPVHDTLTSHALGSEWAPTPPCSPTGCDGAAFGVPDLSVQGAQGWRIPTIDEMTAAVASSVGAAGWDELSGPSSDVKCASAYFTDTTRCN